LGLDEKTGNQEVKPLDYQLLFDPAITQIMQIEYFRRVAEVDYGYFYPILEKYTYIYDFSVFSLFVSKDFLAEYFDYRPEFRTYFLTMRLSLSRTDVVDKIVYEKFCFYSCQISQYS
jgi:hypothetical protein